MADHKLHLVTLGVRNLSVMREFYERLGWTPALEDEDFAAFANRGAVLGLFPIEKLAADGRVPHEAVPKGFRGFSLAWDVSTPDQVDEAIETVRSAGGRITKEPEDAEFFEGRSAYWMDPEENLWEVAWLGRDNKMIEIIKQTCGDDDL
jgi:uncharacterized protein